MANRHDPIVVEYRYEGPTMPALVYPDTYDWRGCPAVEFDPEKLSGRATVGSTRMFADGIWDSYLDGMTVEEIVESYGVDDAAVRVLLDFAIARGLKATA